MIAIQLHLSSLAIVVVCCEVRYWYKNGALRPDLVTVFIAMDQCTKVNGGLQVITLLHDSANGTVSYSVLRLSCTASYNMVNRCINTN